MFFYTMFGGPLDGQIKSSDEPLIRYYRDSYNGTYHYFDDFAIFVKSEESLDKP